MKSTVREDQLEKALRNAVEILNICRREIAHEDKSRDFWQKQPTLYLIYDAKQQAELALNRTTLLKEGN